MTRLLAVTGILCLLSSCGYIPHAPRGTVVRDAPPKTLVPGFGGWGFERVPNPEAPEDIRVEDFHFRSYCDVLGRFQEEVGQIYLPLGEGPFPLIVVSPILGGAKTDYLECRIVGRLAARRGYASFYLYQELEIFKPYEDATDLERKLRSSVRSMTRALDVILDQYPVRADKIGSFGISLGAIRSVLWVASDPRARASVVCLAGGGFEEIVRGSRERMVTRYRMLRRESALTDDETIYRDFGAHLWSDPLWIADAVDPRQMLMFLAGADDKVPIATGWALYEALGRPDVRTCPLGHYTSILVLPWVIRHSFRFFDHRLGVHPPGSSG